VLDAGGTILQETRLFDSDTGETASMRSKEEAHDYRYFPEPDLPPLWVDERWIEEIRARLPELPEARKARLAAAYGLSQYDADVLVRLSGGADYFESMVHAGAPAKAASNWLQGEVRRKLKELGADDMRSVPFAPEALAELVVLTERGTISSSAAKQVFEAMWTTGRRAGAIVEAEGLAQIGDESLLAGAIDDVLRAHAAVAADYRAGKAAAFGFLVGQVMKATKGKANPRLVNELLKKALGD
jgi:aspartyl-tRNA(Asn)/glutamyl-tRNA(Gln) amidotransferase subunit B